MISWKRLYPKPGGSLPGGVVTQWGVGIITIRAGDRVRIWFTSDVLVPRPLKGGSK